MDINAKIQRLIEYGLDEKLITKEDEIYVRNQILEVLDLEEYKETIVNDEKKFSLKELLNDLLEWAYEHKRIKENTTLYRDLLDTKIMNCFMKRPSEVINKFYELYRKDPKKATDDFYHLCIASNYIRMDRIQKNRIWKSHTSYGDMDITINLSKPEKDPKEIAALKNSTPKSYPKCFLCKENEGYRGSINHPARQNHRIIPIKLGHEKWFFQYSPYVYYNEHCIVFNEKHDPMKICKNTFYKLLDFVDQFPHYFVGSNADLPIVGGSILTHDHFQGGNYEFPMAKAPIEKTFDMDDQVEMGIVRWPMSVIRLKSKDAYKMVDVADYILNCWRSYKDQESQIIPYTDKVPHNTITPIARKRDTYFELDLVLRNNRTNSMYPYGIFHPHDEVHHIKKENIGLIEVMGLAVLPKRLKEELEKLKDCLLNKNTSIKDDPMLDKHKDWFKEIQSNYKNIDPKNIEKIIQDEVGHKFSTVLEHAGVFKRDGKGKKGFLRFIEHVKTNYKR